MVFLCLSHFFVSASEKVTSIIFWLLRVFSLCLVVVLYEMVRYTLLMSVVEKARQWRQFHQMATKIYLRRE